ncbi:MAG: aminodeoxychorismate/anthranilate synthase component II [Magnetovibrio sp.]|nr:aminodeoxychorismate/anthranilate synthase component II [Magnetovibrio sp.]|tara:strand:+ start:898 stop:1476 length:579 start_codon:yes stop_codon:yes gene_type:complete
MFLLIDNYDSFVYNLRHFMGEIGADVVVYRNDAIGVEDVLTMKPDGIVLSPGPCDPDQAGVCLDIIRCLEGKIPILGVCLGHQCIGQVFGGEIVRSPEPMHGKISTITHNGAEIFNSIPSPFKATRYHSLTVANDSVPKWLKVTAKSEDGVIQGLSHKKYPIHGVQFHPESIASEYGHRLLENFVNMSRGRL